MKLSYRFEDALLMATRLHANQKRKGADIPYVSHLLAVASLVLEEGGTEDQAIAALLHDAVEDQGGRDTLERIREEFGEDVAKIVDECTDAYDKPKPEWRKRKENYIVAIAHKSQMAREVSVADKLHNARSILIDYRSIGEELWDRFTGGKDGTIWYYRSLVEAFETHDNSRIVAELRRVVEEIERTILETPANSNDRHK